VKVNDMEVGDLVKTKVPGFGTGNTVRLGTVVNNEKFMLYNHNGPVFVMHDDGEILEWYPWQLEVINEGR